MMDSETPELVAFYQQNNYEFVKDIFMDPEVVPSLMKRCLVDNCELDHNNISCMLNSVVDINSDSTSETLESVSNDSCKDVIKKCGSVNLVMEHDSDAKGYILHNCSIEKIVPKTHLVGEVPGREADLSNYMVSVSSATEVINDNSSTSEMEEWQQNADFKQFLETESTSKKPQDSTFGSLIINSSTESIVDQNVNGESADSFSAGSLSCHTPYSESISLRSNSSSASSRSFAFPILPPEWNGSPVRMVKPDRRQMIKHRNRRMSFLCCQF
ncbi:hypothetical protein Ddye_002013 [Dipteronia dyeriana]|uniref:Uncharacterized protein n=1 Tax=Dipteronia dyeriana TaxID=168575 RepID=A0AAD9XPQ8_9ROSI|nr:hypothetical protein Ddye_002013 [Dipteronia dyeriana]